MESVLAPHGYPQLETPKLIHTMLLQCWCRVPKRHNETCLRQSNKQEGCPRKLHNQKLQTNRKRLFKKRETNLDKRNWYTENYMVRPFSLHA